MKNVIDLRPYLNTVEMPAPRRRILPGIAAALEAVVTLAIGFGFFFALIAFFCAI